MARPLRLEFNNALYLVVAKGQDEQTIFKDDDDREEFLRVLQHSCERYGWILHGYALLDDSYFLVVRTPKPNLSKGMRQLNGVYTQSFNRRHNVDGHLFQGRFKSIVVDEKNFLAPLLADLSVEPVRAGIVRTANQWRWTSHRTLLGKRAPAPWFDLNGALAVFADKPAAATEAYKEAVGQARGRDPVWLLAKHQIFLGDAAFIKRMQKRLQSEADRVAKEGKARPRPASVKSLASYEKRFKDRDRAIYEAFASGHYTQSQIADHFKLHYTTISRIVSRQEAKND